jgi:hypothetical protein
MSNIIPKNQTLVQAAAALSAPAIAEGCNEINQYVKRWLELERKRDGYWRDDDYGLWCNGEPWTAAELEEVENFAAMRPALRQLWAVVSQPATKDQTAILIGKALLGSFPNLNNVEGLNYTAENIMEEIVAEGPLPLYVLYEAIRATRRENQFLSIPAVLEGIKKARAKAKQYGRKLNGNGYDMDSAIIGAKRDLDLISPHEAERQHEQLRARHGIVRHKSCLEISNEKFDEMCAEDARKDAELRRILKISDEEMDEIRAEGLRRLEK